MDVETGEVFASVVLDVTPNELTGASGDVEAGNEAPPEGEEGHDHEDEEHEDHDHDHDHEGESAEPSMDDA